MNLQDRLIQVCIEDVELPEPDLPKQSAMSEKMDTVLGLTPSTEHDPQYTLLEQHCYLEIEDYDVACPYIVTIEEQSQKSFIY